MLIAGPWAGLTALVVAMVIGVMPVQAQSPAVDVEQVPCLLVEQNSVIRAQVTDNVPETFMRLYFRRLHEEVEDFYWVEMQARGNGQYWGVLPKPADEVLERRELQSLEEEVRERWARWWRQKEILDDRDPNDDLDTEMIVERASIGRQEPRNWMESFDDAGLERWLDELDYEPTEYYAALYDAFGQRLVSSGLRVTQVRDVCDTNLTPVEAGLAENLTVGETAPWQVGKEVFHWLCDGVISRIDAAGVFRGDSICRACVVAWWKKENFLLPLAAGVVGGGVLLVDDDEPPEGVPLPALRPGSRALAPDRRPAIAPRARCFQLAGQAE